jgi:AraC-like DNA-binding protein
MKLEYVFYALIPFLTLLQGLIFAILATLRCRREERNSDKWLAFSLFLLAINGIPYMLGWLGIDILWEKYTYLPWDGFWLAIPPTLYLFLKSLTNETWRFSWKNEGKFYIPYAIYAIEHTIIGVMGQFDKPFVQWWWNEISYFSWFYEVLDWAINIYFFVKAYKLYRQYQTWSLEHFSNTEKVEYQWFRNFLIVYFSLYFIGELNSLYSNYVAKQMGHTQYDVQWLGYLTDTILMYYLSISSYMQTRVRGINFIEKPLVVSETLQENFEEIQENDSKSAQITEGGISVENEPSKAKAGLSEADLEQWKQRILNLFDKEKPYLNPELTLSDLAEQLKTNTSVLSAVINSGFDKNFNDFVNSYRIEDFKTKIKMPQFKHLTLLAVAFECGFNSKTTFNRAFKKQVGQNPSDFQT